MSIPVGGDLFQVTMFGTLFNQRIINTWHYVVDTNSGGIDRVSVEQALFEQMTNVGDVLQLLDTMYPSDLTMDNVYVQQIHSPRYIPSIFPGLGAGAGGATETTNTAAFFMRRPEQSGRGYKGGIHVPLPTLAHADGALSAAYSLLADTLLAALNAGKTRTLTFGVNTVRLLECLVARVSAPLPGYSYRLVHDWPSYNPYVRTMRSRTVGHGE